MVAVAVVIAVAVVTVAGVDVGAVEEDRHVAVAVLVVVFLDVGEFIFFEETRTNHEDGHIGKTVDYLGIGDNLNRGQSRRMKS